MKVFTCTDFEGHWGMKTAAIIVAENEEQAKKLLSPELRACGLHLGDATLTEISMTEPFALVLVNGDY